MGMQLLWVDSWVFESPSENGPLIFMFTKYLKGRYLDITKQRPFNKYLLNKF